MLKELGLNNDVSEIQEAFDLVIKNSQELDKIDTSNLFKDWFKNKEYFIKAFNGKLIYELSEPVQLELNPSDRRNLLINFIDALYRRNYYELGDYLDSQKDGFYHNKTISSYTVKGGMFQGQIIPERHKLVKAFKYFIPDKEECRKIQDEASCLIQKDSVEGTLCLSVHPLDYLSISENQHNWRSCHALDGEYRSGNLNYMADSSTVICYLKAKDDVKLPHFPNEVQWNSKKWRVLLYFSNDKTAIFASKQYPFYSCSALDIIKDKILCLFETDYNKWSNWNDKCIKDFEGNGFFCSTEKYYPLKNSLIKISDLIQDCTDALFFNDVLRSSVYEEPKYIYLVHKLIFFNYTTPLANEPQTRFTIGQPVKCLRCGLSNIQISESMYCNDCELKYGHCDCEDICYCDHCGCRMFEFDGCWIGDHDIYCEDCTNNYTETCATCGERYDLSELIYNEETDKYFCEWCKIDEEEGEYA